MEDEGTTVKKLAKVQSEPLDPDETVSSEANGTSDDPLVHGMLLLGVLTF